MNLLTILTRHVDRDMYMRYRGNAIGHQDPSHFGNGETVDTGAELDDIPEDEIAAIMDDEDEEEAGAPKRKQL